MTERNSVLKDRIIELEGVVLRWKDKVDRAAETLAASAAPHSSMYYDSVALTPAEIEAGELTMRVEALSQKLFEAEEYTRQLRTQHEHSQERAETMRQLTEHLRRDEKELLNSHAEQLARVRMSLEERHAVEIRELRFNYESEKRHLERELAMVADAIQKEMQYETNAGALRAVSPAKHRNNKRVSDARSDASGDRNNGSFADSEHESNVSSNIDQGVSKRDDNVYNTPESVQLLRRLQAMEDRYEIAQNQIKELEDLLRVQRSTFLSMQQHSSAAFDLSDEESSILSDKRVDDLLSETVSNLRGLHDSQFSWLKALQSAAENGLPIMSGPTEAAMMASELSAQVRALIAKIQRVKQLWGHVVTHTEKQQPMDTVRSEEFKESDVSNASDKFISELRHLKVKARGIEEALHEVASVPDKHVISLRELRTRFSNLEDIHSTEVERIKAEFKDAQTAFEAKISALEKDIAVERSEADKAKRIRDEYEAKVKNLQDSLETQSVANVDRVSELHKQLNEERSKFNRALGSRYGIAMHQEIPERPEERTVDPAGAYPFFASTQNADEVLHLKKQVSAATEEAERAKSKLTGLQSQHSSEMESLRSHFHRFRDAQQEVISALENQLSELRNGESEIDEFSDVGGDHTFSTYNQEFGSNASLQDAQERMMKLATKHRMKQMELNAVLRAMSAAGAGVSSDKVDDNKNAHGTKSAKNTESKNQEWGNFGSAVPLREELLEARVTAAEKEVRLVRR